MGTIEIQVQAKDAKQVTIKVETNSSIWRNVVTLHFDNGDYCDVNFKTFCKTACYLTTYENVDAVDAFIEGLKEGKNSVSEQLAEAYGIKIGNRYRIDHLCSDNDQEILGIDFKAGEVKMKRYLYGYKDGMMDEYFTCSLMFVIKNLADRNMWNRWIQIDENRNTIKE